MHSGEQVQSTYCTQSPKYRHPDSVNRAPVTTDRLVPQKTSILQKKPTVDFAKQAKLWRKRARVESVFLHRNPCLPGVQLCIVVCGLASSLTVLFAVRKKMLLYCWDCSKNTKLTVSRQKKEKRERKRLSRPELSGHTNSHLWERRWRRLTSARKQLSVIKWLFYGGSPVLASGSLSFSHLITVGRGTFLSIGNRSRKNE